MSLKVTRPKSLYVRWVYVSDWFRRLANAVSRAYDKGPECRSKG